MDQHNAGDGDADEPRQGRRDDSTSRDSRDVPGMAVSGGYVGFSEILLDGFKINSSTQEVYMCSF